MKLLRRFVAGNPLVALSWVALLFLAHAALFGFAFAGHLPAFAVAMLVAFVAEWGADRRAPRILALLGKLYAGLSQRWLAREAALLVLVAISGTYDRPRLAATCAGIVSIHVVRTVALALRELLVRMRRLPLYTRKIDLAALRIPDAPPRWIANGGRRRPMLLGLPAIAGVLADALIGTSWLGIAGVGLGLAVGLLATVVLVAHVFRARHLADRDWVRATVLDAVRAYSPEVVLYYSSGSRATRFQVDMWLKPLSHSSRRAIVIVRESMHLRAIGDSTVPIVCLPSGTDVMNLEAPDLKVVLYVGNVGKNIHMLRTLGARHVFVGHGDSDKGSSAVPASRAYDEVWVAGRAGRDRYHRAGVGVRDEAIVEVGRPQLAEITPATANRPMFTVLYAPTWEGWSNDMMLTSLADMGVAIVGTLLAMSPEVRVIYKPHPMAGTRSAAVKAAHREIVRLLSEAAAQRLRDPGWSDRARASESERAMAREKMAGLTAEAQALRAGDPRADLAQFSRDSVRMDAAAHARLEQIDREWREAFWAAQGYWTHTAVVGPSPHLYSCFNEADLMISDISSVVSDFIASGKPYVMTNPQDIDPDTYRAEQTASGGAYLLGSDVSALAPIVDAVRNGTDPMAERRELTREYLLGPTDPPALSRFTAAIERLCLDGQGAAVRHAPEQRLPSEVAPRTGSVVLP